MTHAQQCVAAQHGTTLEKRGEHRHDCFPSHAFGAQQCVAAQHGTRTAFHHMPLGLRVCLLSHAACPSLSFSLAGRVGVCLLVFLSSRQGCWQASGKWPATPCPTPCGLPTSRSCCAMACLLRLSPNWLRSCCTASSASSARPTASCTAWACSRSCSCCCHDCDSAASFCSWPGGGGGQGGRKAGGGSGQQDLLKKRASPAPTPYPRAPCFAALAAPLRTHV